jgi:hypothetical protein
MRARLQRKSLRPQESFAGQALGAAVLAGCESGDFRPSDLSIYKTEAIVGRVNVY